MVPISGSGTSGRLPEHGVQPRRKWTAAFCSRDRSSGRGGLEHSGDGDEGVTLGEGGGDQGRQADGTDDDRRLGMKAWIDKAWLHLRGAVRSWTIWFNGIVAAGLAGL